ncbi:MAG: hypothetical protein JST80_00830 [Bdellovibrionales bacterium]|nr:hypothetical protein [Bdellovibrionales bacterium]
MKTLFAFIALAFSLNAGVAHAGWFSVPAFLAEGYPKMSGCTYGFSKSREIIAMYDELMMRAIQASGGDGHFVSLSKYDDKTISPDSFYAIQDQLIRKKSSIPGAVWTEVLVKLIAAAGSQAGSNVSPGQIADFIMKHIPAPTRTSYGFDYKSTNDAARALTKMVGVFGQSADGKNPWGYELAQATVFGGNKARVDDKWVVVSPVDPKTEELVSEFYRMTAEFGRAGNESTQMGFLFGSQVDVKEEIIETILGDLQRAEIQPHDLKAAVAEAYRIFGALAHFRVSGVIDQATLVDILNAVKNRSVEVFGTYKSELETIKAAWGAEDVARRIGRVHRGYDETKRQLTLLNDFFWINGGSIGLGKIAYY